MQRAITITVGPLEADESQTLADALVGSELLETDRLVAAAEGNPLFLEQLAAEARELGEAWDPSAAPTTIRALLEARLDRCSPDVTSALELASVQGSRFRVDLLRALAPEGLDLGDVLRQADRAHLAREVEPNVGTFAHALVRETAYNRLPKATRAELHAAIADLFPEEEEELAAIHLEQAATLRAELGHADIELEQRAGELLARTGARAFSRLDFVTASDLLERAAALLPPGSAARLEMLPDFAIALMEAGRAEDAAALLEEALVQADQFGSRRDAIRIRLQQLALYAFTGPSEDEIRLGISEGRELLAELTDLDDDVGLAQGWTVIEYLHVLDRRDGGPRGRAGAIAPSRGTRGTASGADPGRRGSAVCNDPGAVLRRSDEGAGRVDAPKPESDHQHWWDRPSCGCGCVRGRRARIPVSGVRVAPRDRSWGLRVVGSRSGVGRLGPRATPHRCT